MTFHVGLVTGEAGFVLRLVDGLAADEPAKAQPPVAAYFFESLIMI
jgi:hypothetical protein